MALYYDVIVVGSYSADLIFTGLSEFPQLGRDVVSTDFKMTPGEAYISAVSLQRLGIHVGWAADFGNDEFSQFTLNCAREEGLDESLFVIHDRPLRRISVAASYPEDRAFITYYDPEPPIPAALPALLKADARLVLIPGLFKGHLLTTGKKIIRAKNISLAMDGNSSSGDMVGKSKECRSISNAIKSVDIFMPNAMETRRLTGEPDLELAIRKLGELCHLVVIKDGSNGSFSCVNGQIRHEPAIQVNSIDTTGAGDNFNAGFLCAWLDGSSLETCLKWGNIVGGLSTTEPGGTTRKITRDQVKAYLEMNA